MSNLFIVTTACALLALAYFQLFPSSNVSDTDSDVEIKLSDSRMVDLCESMSLLFQSGMFSDLTVKVSDSEQTEYKVHKSVLSARSEVFCQMLESQKDLDKIVLDGISKRAASQLLFFVYTGHTEELSVEVAAELLAAADKYKLNPLQKLCSDILVENLNLDNVIELLSLSSSHNDEDLQKAAVAFIVDNTLESRQHEKWQEFIETHPKLVDEVIGSLATKRKC